MALKKNINKAPLKTAPRLSKRKLRGGWRVAAGYPAEAYNYEEKGLNLNEHIIRSKENNRCIWATHIGLIGGYIEIGDLIVFDKAIEGKKDSYRIFLIDDDYTIRRVLKYWDHLELISPNPKVKSIIITEGETLECKGVVTHIIKKYANYHSNYSGYPVDALNYIEEGMDYNKYLVDMWETTFYLWAQGNSMIGDGIENGDLLIVDNMPNAFDDSILVYVIDNNHTLKRVEKHEDYNLLISSNPDIPPIRINKGDEMKRWGLLTAVVKKVI